MWCFFNLFAFSAKVKDLWCHHEMEKRLSLFTLQPVWQAINIKALSIYICNAVVVVVRLYQVFVFCLDVSSSLLLPSCITCKSTFLYLSSWTNSFCALTQIFEQSTPLLYKTSLLFSSRLYCDFYTLIKSCLTLMLI